MSNSECSQLSFQLIVCLIWICQGSVAENALSGSSHGSGQRAPVQVIGLETGGLETVSRQTSRSPGDCREPLSRARAAQLLKGLKAQVLGTSLFRWPSWEDALSLAPPHYLGSTGAVSNLHDEVIELIRSLPSDRAAEYREWFGVASEKALERVSKQTGRERERALFEVAYRYPLTDGAKRASVQLMRIHLDKGRAPLASLLGDYLLANYSIKEMDPASLMTIAECFRGAGDWEKAAEVLQSLQLASEQRTDMERFLAGLDKRVPPSPEKRNRARILLEGLFTNDSVESTLEISHISPRSVFQTMWLPADSRNGAIRNDADWTQDSSVLFNLLRLRGCPADLERFNLALKDGVIGAIFTLLPSKQLQENSLAAFHSAFESALHNSDSRIRLFAVRELANHGHARRASLELLSTAIADEDFYLRKTSQNAISSHPDILLEALKRNLNHPDPEIRKEMLDTLIILKGRLGLPLFNNQNEFMEMIAELESTGAARAVGKELSKRPLVFDLDVTFLTSLLKSENEHARYAALVAFEDFGPQGADRVRYLDALLARFESDWGHSSPYYSKVITHLEKIAETTQTIPGPIRSVLSDRSNFVLIRSLGAVRFVSQMPTHTEEIVKILSGIALDPKSNGELRIEAVKGLRNHFASNTQAEVFKTWGVLLSDPGRPTPLVEMVLLQLESLGVKAEPLFPTVLKCLKNARGWEVGGEAEMAALAVLDRLGTKLTPHIEEILPSVTNTSNRANVPRPIEEFLASDPSASSPRKKAFQILRKLAKSDSNALKRLQALRKSPDKEIQRAANLVLGE